MKLSTLAIATTAVLSASVSAHDIGHEHEHVEGGWNAKAGFVSDVDVKAELWNPRGKSQEEINARAEFITEAYFSLTRTPEQQERAKKLREKYADAIAINAVMPTSDGLVGNDYETFTKGIMRNKEGGITVASSTVFAHPAFTNGMTAYDVVERSEKALKDTDTVKVMGTEDIYSAKKAGKSAVVFSTQGSDYVIEDMHKHAEQSDKTGIKIMNFTYNLDNGLAGGSEKNDSGLTEMGQAWVKVAQDNNIVIDVSHSSNQSAIDAAKVATKPIMASHSNSYSLFPVSRNMTDEAMLAIASTDGVVCPTGAGLFLNKELDASPERYVEHVVYVADLIGKDKVCFSTDMVHNYLDYAKSNLAGSIDVYPPELGFGSPLSNLGAEHIWDVAAILEDKYGWSEKEVRGFLGENVMRVFAANWN